jgi:hypothetical protein
MQQQQQQQAYMVSHMQEPQNDQAHNIRLQQQQQVKMNYQNQQSQNVRPTNKCWI